MAQWAKSCTVRSASGFDVHHPVRATFCFPAASPAPGIVRAPSVDRPQSISKAEWQCALDRQADASFARCAEQLNGHLQDSDMTRFWTLWSDTLAQTFEQVAGTFDLQVHGANMKGKVRVRDRHHGEVWARPLLRTPEGDVALASSSAGRLVRQANRLLAVADQVRATRSSDPLDWHVTIRQGWKVACDQDQGSLTGAVGMLHGSWQRLWVELKRVHGGLAKEAAAATAHSRAVKRKAFKQ
eukprot:11481968-Alexandrium_andersonii.AAC.1